MREWKRGIRIKAIVGEYVGLELIEMKLKEGPIV